MEEAISNAESERDSMFAVIERDAYRLQCDGGPLPGRDNPSGSSLNVNYSQFIEYMDGLYGNMEILNSANKRLEEAPIPDAIGLFTFPNPFNSVVNIQYDLPENAKVKLSVYDLFGREIEVLIQEPQSAGHYNLIWNPSNNASGVYLCRLEAGSVLKTNKMILIK